MGKLRWTNVASSALLNLALIAMLTACAGGNAGNAADNGPGDTSPATRAYDSSGRAGTGGNGRTDELQVALVTDVGGVHDNSFNQSAWEGLKKFGRDHGGKVDYLQSQREADYVPNLNQLVKSGHDLTWGIGYTMREAVKQVANQNPEAKIGIIDAEVDAPNVKSVTFRENEGGFLAGVVAGMMTKSDKIGFVGGAAIPATTRLEAGFKAGIEAVNPEAKLVVQYTGVFDAPDKGKKAAATIYNEGADIIFHAAGSTGDGVFAQAKEMREAGRHAWVIGVDKDQAKTFGDDITLTSILKRVDVAIYTISKEVQRDAFKGGEVATIGLKENGFGFPKANPNVPKEVMERVESFKKRIIDGGLTVPEQ